MDSNCGSLCCRIAPSRQASPSKPGKQRPLALSRTRKTKSSPVLPDKIDNQDKKNIDSDKDKPEDAAAVDVSSKDADSNLSQAMVEPNQLESTSDPMSPLSEHLDFLSAMSTPLYPHKTNPPLIPPVIPQRTASSKTDQKPANTDDGELAILVDKILSTSDLIIEVVTVIRLERGGLESQTLSQAPERQPGSFDTYSRVMGPLQFGECMHVLYCLHVCRTWAYINTSPLNSFQPGANATR